MLGPIRPLLVVALAATVCGCAQTGRMANPLAWMKKPEPEAQAEAETAPFKPATEETAEKTEEGETQVAATDPPAAEEAEPKPDEAAPAVAAAETTPAEPPKDDEKPAGTVHDAETLALIDEELKHATPEEREKLFNEWKSLDAAMVQQVIRIRRMVRELESASPAATAATGTSPPALPGTTSPWNGDTATAAAPDEETRVLPLGSDAAAAEGELVAQALPTIQAAGHDVPKASPAVQTAAFGHSTTQPVPVIEAMAGINTSAVNANGPPPAPPADAAPSASSTATNDPWIAQVRQLVAAAEARAEQARVGFLDRPAGSPPADDAARRFYVESQVHLRLLYLMAGEQARAMQAIPGLDAADQEFWQQILWGVSNYFDEAALPNRADRVTQTVEQLRTAVTRLQGEANLQLRNVAFSHDIKGFGSFERFERDEYTPGQEVLLYAEIVNFKSVPQPSDGLYKTQIKSTLEIYRAGQGQPVKKIEFDPTVDLCRSYRQDYFHTYSLKIPADLTLGPHVLKLTVEDLQSGKVATYSMNFTVK